MPYTRMQTAKDGRRYYKIEVSRGRGKSYLSKRWYVPDGWSEKVIQRELAKVAAEFEQQCHDGEIISHAEQRQREAEAAAEAAKIRTVSQYAQRVFMPAKTVTMSENSRSSYQSYLDSTILPAIGSVKLPEVTPAQINALLLSVQAAGKAHATVVKIYTILQGLFKMAYRMDDIPKNPMDKVDRPKPRKDEVQKTEPEAYTAAEVQPILTALESEPLKWQVLIRLLIETGIRRGECCALRWENVNFETGAVTIAGNLCYTAAKGIYLDTPKNGHIRTVYIGTDTLHLLREYRTTGKATPLSGYIFTQEDSKEPMHPQTPTRYLKKFSQRHNIPDLHPHKLRHTFASVAITSGADIASVSEALGHRDKAVTLRMYTHASEESISKASELFREALKKAAEG